MVFQRFKQFFRRENGNATIEFVILFPFYLGVVFGGIEAGWLMTRHMLVETGVSVVMRSVRLGTMEDPTYTELRDAICTATGVIPDCENDLIISTEVLSPGEAVSPDPVPCTKADLEIVGEFDPSVGHSTGDASQIVVIKVCALAHPIFMGFGFAALLPLEELGGWPIRTKSAFLNEPY